MISDCVGPRVIVPLPPRRLFFHFRFSGTTLALLLILLALGLRAGMGARKETGGIRDRLPRAPLRTSATRCWP
ncbi:MAG: hypothetical protein ACK53Y_17795, partial [bacterium]